MTEQTAAPAAVTPEAAFAAAKAESLGQPTTPPNTAVAPPVAATGADDVGAAAVAAAATAAAQAAPQIAAPAIPDAPLDAKAGEGDIVVYDDVGDPGMNLALGFIGKLGIKPTDPEMVEAGKGNFAFLKAKLATLGDKATGWEQYVAIGEASYANAVKEGEAKTGAINAAIGTVCDKPTLDKVLAFAAANASPEEKAYFNEQLARDPLAARLAAAELLRLYQASPGTQLDPAPVTTALPGNLSEGASAPLTRREYTQQVDAIAKRVGGSNLESSPEYQALNRRFAAQR